MHDFAGAQSEQDAFERYLPLRLQEKAAQPSSSSTAERKICNWTELVTIPQIFLF